MANNIITRVQIFIKYTTLLNTDLLILIKIKHVS